MHNMLNANFNIRVNYIDAINPKNIYTHIILMEKTTSTKNEEEYDDMDDIAQCPVLKDQLSSLTPEQVKEMRSKYDAIVKPMLKNRPKAAEEEKKEKTTPPEEKKSKVRKQHPRFEKYKQSQGSCPYMNTSISP